MAITLNTKGVFGMRGDFANLPEICRLKKKYSARLFVDDAHGFGVIGPTGRGTGEHFNLQDEIDIYFGTFAKTFVSIGGVTCADKSVITYLRMNARPEIFSKALPLVLVSAIDKAADLIQSHPEYREKMWYIANKLQTGLRDLGYCIDTTQSVITPIYIKNHDLNLALEMMRILREEYHVFVSGVTHPVVPPGVLLFRLIPTASHSDHDVEKTLEAFKNLRDTYLREKK